MEMNALRWSPVTRHNRRFIFISFFSFSSFCRVLVIHFIHAESFAGKCNSILFTIKYWTGLWNGRAYTPRKNMFIDSTKK